MNNLEFLKLVWSTLLDVISNLIEVSDIHLDELLENIIEKIILRLQK